MPKKKNNKELEKLPLFLTKYIGTDSGLVTQDVIKIMIVLMENLFFNMTSSDALLLSFMSVKDSIEKMDMDTEKGVEFLIKLYLAADKRRQQNFLS